MAGEGTVRSVGARDGARLEYATAGSGPPLVLLHGIMAGRRAFSRQAPALAAHFRLVLPSARGHDGSASTMPADYGAGSSDVDDLLAVLAAEAIDETLVLAHSSGGATAAVLAARHPERVRRMLLIEPSLLSSITGPEAEALKQGVRDVVAAAPRVGPGPSLRASLDLVGGAAWARLDEGAKAARVQALAPVAPLCAPHWRSLLELPLSDDDIRQWRPPTLLAYGGASFPFERLIAEHLAALRPDLPLVRFATAGHNVHRDSAEAFNATALAFLRQD